MTILLGLLKWIGIIALILLALVIVLILIALFVPIRYRLTAYHPETYVKLQGSFLLHMFHITYQYEDKKGKLKIRIFGIPIVWHNKSKKKPKKIAHKKGIKTKKKTPIWSYIKRYLRNKHNEIPALIWQQLLYLLKHMKPKHLTCNLSFSTGDPANTGMLVGGISLFPILMKPGVIIQPDFMEEKRYIRGNIDGRGRIHGLTLLIVGIRIYSNQQIRNLFKNNKEA